MVRSVRFLDTSGVCVATHEVTDDSTLEDLLVLLVVETGLDMDDVEVRIASAPPPPTSPSSSSDAQAWLSSASPHLADTLIALGLPAGPVDCEVQFRPRAKPVAETIPAAAVTTRPAATPIPSGPNRRILEIFGSSASGAHPAGQPGTSSGPSAVASSAAPPPPAGNAEFHRRLEEAVQQRAIDESFVNAMEYTPEAFAPVTMLYVDCEINGHPLKAFVDSGAQMSIMNTRTAEVCGLTRLVDKRMSGVAKGVGMQRILGRVHIAQVNLNGLFIPFSFSVLENQEMDIIIGLDQLRRYRMKIDLSLNSLVIGDTQVPFLPDSQLPDYAKPQNAKTYDEQDIQKEEEESKKTIETLKLSREKAEAARKEAAEKQKAASASPPSPPQQQQRQQQQQQSSSMPELTADQSKAVDQLMDLTGNAFGRLQAFRVLEAADWNVETAAGLLYEDN